MKAVTIRGAHRVLTQTELAEHVQALPPAQRTAYHTLSGLGSVTMFLLATLLTWLLIVLLFPLIGEVYTETDELLLATVMALCSVMACIGFSGNPVPEHALPDDTLSDSVRRAALSGLRSAAVIGFVFGLIWGFIVNYPLIFIKLNTLVDPTLNPFDFVKFGFAFALVVTLPFVLLRIYQTAQGALLLRRFERRGQ